MDRESNVNLHVVEHPEGFNVAITVMTIHFKEVIVSLKTEQKLLLTC